ncbi:MAG TPA: hypothetical protein VFZ00_20810 [Solirubrobacter sp.]|nr:hypothetical protein [Solirubrobacter sp.]
MKHFIRHYVEMVLAMLIGMGLLYMPAELVLNAFGSGWDELSDALMFLGMAVTMTIPMVAWMIYRGHRARASTEMAAAMILPAFAVIGLLTADVLTDVGALMVIEHVAMLLAMLGAMLLRPSEYMHGAHA